LGFIPAATESNYLALWRGHLAGKYSRSNSDEPGTLNNGSRSPISGRSLLSAECLSDLLAPVKGPAGRYPLLVRHFVGKYSQRLQRNIEYIPDEVMDVQERYEWPGNIRELQNVVECAAILCEGNTLSLDETHLKPETSHRSGAAVSLVMTIADKEREIIEAALAECGGRVAGPKGAAAKLKISRQTLDSKIACLNIDKRRFQILTCLSRLPETSSFASAITVASL
jgi:Bacterial regulatory protein, Fis family